MIGGKTAALISGSMETGAFLGTDYEPYISNFRDIGRNLGLAFQIRDDILGIWGDEEETGKPAGNDIRRKKKNFPVVYALEHTVDATQKELISIYQNGLADEKTVNRVLEIFEMVDTKTNAQKMVQRYCSEASRAFKNLKLSRPAQKDMDEMVQFLTGRTY
jgi:geranylgeranyl diphosphate synthase type I